jgi:PAS domain S-box-containing protein
MGDSPTGIAAAEAEHGVSPRRAAAPGKNRHAHAPALTLSLEGVEPALAEAAVRALLNAPYEMAVLVARDGRILAANEAFADFFRRPLAALIGVSIFDVLPPDIAAQRRAMAAEVVRTGVPARYESNLSERFLEVTMFPAGDDRPAHWIALFARDVTEQKRAEEELRRRTRQLEAVNAITAVIGGSYELNTVLEQVLNTVMKVLEFDFGGIYYVEEGTDQLVLAKHVGVSESLAQALGQFGLDDSVAGHLFADVDRLVFDDLRGADDFALQAASDEGIGSGLVILLRPEGRVIGGIALGNREPRRLSTEEIALIDAVGRQVGLVVEKVRLYQRAQQRAEQLASLQSIARAIASTLELEEIFTIVTEHTRRFLGADRASLALVRDDGSYELCCVSVSGEPTSLGRGTVIDGADTPWSRIASGYRPVCCDDISGEAAPILQALGREGIRAQAWAPVMVEGRCAAVLSAGSRRRAAFGAGHVNTLQEIAGHVAVALRNARMYEEIRGAYRDLQEAQSQLVQTEKLRALGGMAAGVAHDFNNILAGVLGNTQLLLQEVTNPHWAARLRTIEKSARDGAAAVRRLQGLTRGSEPSRRETVPLDELVEDALASVRPDDASGIGPEVTVLRRFEGAPAAYGCPAELRDVVRNIVLNAFDALPEGGCISITGGSRGDRAWLAIADDGIGMSDEVRQRAFDPFFTTKADGGTGLGLSLAQGIVSRHEGSLAVQSAPGEGSTFTLELPAARTVAAKPPAPACPSPATTHRILLIDDDDIVRETIAGMLAGAGHRVTSARCGREGVESFRTGEFSLVITDLGMPDLSGWQVVEAVRERAPDIAVIVLSGWGEPVRPAVAEKAGVQLMLTKPVALDELLGAVAMAAGGAEPVVSPSETESR